jgi:hypothetical protein
VNKLWMWGIAAGLVAAVPAFSQNSPPQAAAAHNQVDPKASYMTSVLLERGKTALQRGDISSARALLTPLAQNDNAEASRCLAQTYDPVWLAKHHVVNLESFEDDDRAARLYVHAAQLGDPVAIAQVNAK